MKKQFWGLLAGLIVTSTLLLTVCGANAGVSRNYEKQGFTALSIASGMKLKVKQGEKYEVTVRTRESQLKLVKVEQAGQLLKFYLPPFTTTTGSIEIFITMPELTRLDLSGGSIADITMNITHKTFSANLSGGTGLTGSLQAQQLELDLSGGSRSSLTGGADTMKIGAFGGSRIQQEGFQVNKADLRLSGGSTAYVFVKEMIEVDSSGGSQVYYRGSPRLGKTSFSGGSGIRSLK
jgi:hypothetical protein